MRSFTCQTDFLFSDSIYMYFSYNIRDNLPLQVLSTDQSPEIKSVFEFYFEKRGNWILVLGRRRGEGRGREVKKGGKMHRFPETSLWFPPRLHLILCSPTPPRQNPGWTHRPSPSLQRCPQSSVLSEPGPSERSQTEYDLTFMLNLKKPELR